MIMRFRPANISLINRRHYLPRLLLTLSSFEKNDQRILTGHYISFPLWRRYDSEADSYLQFNDVITAEAGVHTAHCDFWDGIDNRN
jgi:hypothetical protein